MGNSTAFRVDFRAEIANLSTFCQLADTMLYFSGCRLTANMFKAVVLQRLWFYSQLDSYWYAPYGF